MADRDCARHRPRLPGPPAQPGDAVEAAEPGTSGRRLARPGIPASDTAQVASAAQGQGVTGGLPGPPREGAQPEQSVIIPAMGKERKNPFTPGQGIAPPHLAGRDEAVRELARKVKHIGGGEPGGNIALYGPCGAGKTVLLAEAERQAAEKGITTRWLIPGRWGGTGKGFVRCLASGVLTDKPRAQGEPGIGAAVAKPRDGRDSGLWGLDVEKTLHRMVKAKPLLLLVDDAHDLPRDIEVCLLFSAERCVSLGFPLLIALAGPRGFRGPPPPGSVGLWERSVPRVGVLRLESREATRSALSIPAEKSGLPFAEDALELLVDESQDYPLFIQLLGRHSWQAAVARDPGADRIGPEDAQAGLRMAEKERDGFHMDRLREIETGGMLSAAVAAAKAFAELDDDGVLSTRELGAALKPALVEDQDAYTAIHVLFALGLVWRTDTHDWAQGIPSLCAFVRKHAPAG